jgi:hypothetical protein
VTWCKLVVGSRVSGIFRKMYDHPKVTIPNTQGAYGMEEGQKQYIFRRENDLKWLLLSHADPRFTRGNDPVVLITYK